MPVNKKINIFSLDRIYIEKLLEKLNLDLKCDYRSQQLFKYLYTKNNTIISKQIFTIFADIFTFEHSLEIVSKEISEMDCSVKILFKCKADGSLIESVLVMEKNRLTICLSSQVGCKRKCKFCLTGKMGFLRNLGVEEIVSQYVLANSLISELSLSHPKIFADIKSKSISNIVYMGMGEPLDNLANVLQSTRIFTDQYGINLSHNKITLSTIGLLPELEDFFNNSNIAIAWSLHSPYSEERSQLIPANVMSSLEELIPVFKKHLSATKKFLFLQYCLFAGINDSLDHAQKLLEILQGIPVKINLIPFNESADLNFRRPDLIQINKFQSFLKAHGFVVTVRLSKGRDISAACGQLAQSKASM